MSARLARPNGIVGGSSGTTRSNSSAAEGRRRGRSGATGRAASRATWARGSLLARRLICRDRTGSPPRRYRPSGLRRGGACRRGRPRGRPSLRSWLRWWPWRHRRGRSSRGGRRGRSSRGGRRGRSSRGGRRGRWSCGRRRTGSCSRGRSWWRPRSSRPAPCPRPAAAARGDGRPGCGSRRRRGRPPPPARRRCPTRFRTWSPTGRWCVAPCLSKIRQMISTQVHRPAAVITPPSPPGRWNARPSARWNSRSGRRRRPAGPPPRRTRTLPSR